MSSTTHTPAPLKRARVASATASDAGDDRSSMSGTEADAFSIVDDEDSDAEEQSVSLSKKVKKAAEAPLELCATAPARVRAPEQEAIRTSREYAIRQRSQPEPIAHVGFMQQMMAEDRDELCAFRMDQTARLQAEIARLTALAKAANERADAAEERADEWAEHESTAEETIGELREENRKGVKDCLELYDKLRAKQDEIDDLRKQLAAVKAGQK